MAEHATDDNAGETGLASVDADISNIWETVDNLVDGFFSILPKLAIGIVVFILFWIIARVIQALIHRATRNSKRANVATVLARLAFWALMILGFLVAVTIIVPSMTPGELVSTLGIGGVAIGFAFKDIFQNLLAGILILLRQPFRVGDEITSGGHTGTVEAIETRATIIKTYDGIRIIVPNSQIYQEPVAVITAYDMVRSQYDVGIGYGDDIGRAMKIALDTMKGIDGVLSDPGPDVLVWDLAASWITLRIRWWTEPLRSNVVVRRSEVLKQVAEALSEAGIDLPFETQVQLFHDQSEETDGDRTKQREGWPAGDAPPKPRRSDSASGRSSNKAPETAG